MTSQIKYKNQIYTIPSDCSLSTGNSCETKTSRMSDGTSTSYSITTFKKPQVSTEREQESLAALARGRNANIF